MEEMNEYLLEDATEVVLEQNEVVEAGVEMIKEDNYNKGIVKGALIGVAIGIGLYGIEKFVRFRKRKQKEVVEPIVAANESSVEEEVIITENE